MGSNIQCAWEIQTIQSTENIVLLPRSFSVLYDWKFSTENREIPLLCIRFFDTQNFLKHWMVPLRIFSVLWDKKFSPEILVTPPPPLLSITFFHTRNFLKHRKGSLQSFLVLWDKIFSTKPFCSPDQLCSPSYAWKFPIPEFFWNTKWGSPTNFFGTVIQKNFNGR